MLEVNVDLTVNKKGECSQITSVENLKSFHIERPSQTCSVELVEDWRGLNIRFYLLYNSVMILNFK